MRVHAFTELAKHKGCGICVMYSEPLPGGLQFISRAIVTLLVATHTMYLLGILVTPYYMLRQKSTASNRNKALLKPAETCLFRNIEIWNF